MEWSEICRNPHLANLPFKIQTDRWGNIVMSPACNEHGLYQASLATVINRLATSGRAITECSVATSEGVKVADVAWMSDAFLTRNRGLNPYPEAPEICVEILSPSNTHGEMEDKKELYFARGAVEFWVCDAEGQMFFYKNTGVIAASQLIEGFPQVVVP
ncbi:MAG: Uma2 family endonuclease [Candidatus Competibacterales bacterium]